MINVDLTTLSGWDDLSEGTYNITVGATAEGYTRIKQSQAVSVVKETIEEYFLTFSSPNSFTLNVVDNTKHWDGTLEYSTDKTNWNTWDGTTVLNSGSNNELYLRGINNTIITGSTATPGSPPFSPAKAVWTLVGDDISCSGNIENLLDYETVSNGQHPVMADFCYRYMFNGCTSLTTAPQLPAITLANSCYNSMFRNCTSLTTPPQLPAITLTYSCYDNMFLGCTSLYVSDTQIPEAQYEWRIPANGVITGTDNYDQGVMFANCLGTRLSDNLAGEVGQQYVYYTQNEPVGNN